MIHQQRWNDPLSEVAHTCKYTPYEPAEPQSGSRLAFCTVTCISCIVAIRIYPCVVAIYVSVKQAQGTVLITKALYKPPLHSPPCLASSTVNCISCIGAIRTSPCVVAIYVCKTCSGCSADYKSPLKRPFTFPPPPGIFHR
jgi:hypothetical protein